MHVNVHCALFITAKLWYQPKSSSSVWVNKEDLYIYTMKYFSAIKKNENFLFVETWVDLENIIFIEINQGKTNSVWCYMWNINYKTNGWI